MISLYSFFAAVVWFNLIMAIVTLFCRKTEFLVKYSNSVLLFSAALGVLRMLLPLDFTFAYVINSYKIMPAVRDFFKVDIMPGEEYLKLSTLLIAVWLVVAVAVFARTICRMMRERKKYDGLAKIANEQVEIACQALELKNACVIVSPAVHVPMVTGLFKAHIYLPELLLPAEQWAQVVRHEYQHFKNRDSLIKLFYLTLSALFWWNPAVHKFQSDLNRMLELRCDARVTREMDDEGKTFYLTSILAVMKQLSGAGTSIPLTASPLVDTRGESLAEQRFKVVLASEEKSMAPQIIMYVLIIAVFLMSYTVLIQSAGFPEGDETEVGVSITPKNAYILILEDGSRQLYVNGEFFWDVGDEMIVDELHSGLPIYERRN